MRIVLPLVIYRVDRKSVEKQCREIRNRRCEGDGILNLRLLAPDIQEDLLNLPRVLVGRSPIKYRDLIPILQDPIWKCQREQWKSVLQATGVD